MSALQAPGWIAVGLILALALLLALLEAAMPALRARVRSATIVSASPAARLRRRMAAEPRNTRRAAALLRVAAIALLLACIWTVPRDARAPVAVVAAFALAMLLLLVGSGWLRRPGGSSERAAGIVFWLLAPFFLASRPAPGARPPPPRDAAETIADIADALATESAERQRMVEALLGLEQRTVEDVMVPRSEIDGLDIRADWDEIAARICQTPHTRLPLFEGDLDRVQGIVHMRLVANELASGRLTKARLSEIAARREALFAPEGTTLYDQLLLFRRLRRRIAFVVDEYGDLQGLVTLEDILEEVVGEFTTQVAPPLVRISARGDGSYVVPGALTVREINRALGWELPVSGPRTLSGLIVERLEAIPEPGTSLLVGRHAIEVLQVAGNAVRTARVWVALAGE